MFFGTYIQHAAAVKTPTNYPVVQELSLQALSRMRLTSPASWELDALGLHIQKGWKILVFRNPLLGSLC